MFISMIQNIIKYKISGNLLWLRAIPNKDMTQEQQVRIKKQVLLCCEEIGEDNCILLPFSDTKKISDNRITAKIYEHPIMKNPYDIFVHCCSEISILFVGYGDKEKAIVIFKPHPPITLSKIVLECLKSCYLANRHPKQQIQVEKAVLFGLKDPNRDSCMLLPYEH